MRKTTVLQPAPYKINCTYGYIRYGGETHVNIMEGRKNVDAKSQDVRQAANMALIEVDKG